MTVFRSRKATIPETNNELFDLDSRGYTTSASARSLLRMSAKGTRTHPRQQMPFSPVSTWLHSSTLKTSCLQRACLLCHFSNRFIGYLVIIPAPFLVQSEALPLSGYKSGWNSSDVYQIEQFPALSTCTRHR